MERPLYTGPEEAGRRLPAIWLMDISEAEKLPESFCLDHFPKRYAKAQRFHFREDRLRCITAGLLLHTVLGVKEADLRCNEYEKPYSDSGPCFSLTHSGRYAALAAGSGPVGLDVECTERVCPEIMPHVFTEDEIAYVGKDRERFYTLWTLKESLSKAIGTGLSMPFRKVSVLPILEGRPLSWQGKDWYGWTQPIDGGQYILSCISGKNEKPEIIRTANSPTVSGM